MKERTQALVDVLLGLNKAPRIAFLIWNDQSKVELCSLFTSPPIGEAEQTAAETAVATVEQLNALVPAVESSNRDIREIADLWGGPLARISRDISGSASFRRMQRCFGIADGLTVHRT